MTCLQNNLGILKVKRPFVFYGSLGGWLPVSDWGLASDWGGPGLNGKGHGGGGVLEQDRADMGLYSKRYMTGNRRGCRPYLYHNLEAFRSYNAKTSRYNTHRRHTVYQIDSWLRKRISIRRRGRSAALRTGKSRSIYAAAKTHVHVML